MSPHEPSSRASTAPASPVEEVGSDLPTARLGNPGRACPVMRGLQLGRYETLERIGRGGLGDVYRARHLDTGGVVALKLMRDADPQSPDRRSFGREMEAAQRLSHPGILPIREGGEFLGSPFYVMPLVPGGSLEDRLRRGPVGIRWAVTVVACIARALEHAHQHDVLHRDLKPANILLGEDDRPLVADFGLARFVDHTSCFTQTGQLLGSFPYMSPEQAAGRGHRCSPRTDVWAMGVILYEMLAGRRPFRGANHLETIDRILRDEPPRPRHIRDGIPADLEALCLRCLEKAPEDRPASAGCLADALEAWLRGEAVPEPSRVAASLRRAVRKAGPRRVRMLSLGGLTLAVGLVFLLPGGPRVASEAPAPPARPPIFDVLGRARPGRPVPLIVDRQPIYGRFVMGGAWSTPNFAKKSAPWVGTPGECLFELIPPDPLRKPYRLHVRLKQTHGTADSALGLYAGRHARATPQETTHFLYRAWYREPAFENLAGIPARYRPVNPPRLQLGFIRITEDARDRETDQASNTLGDVSLASPTDPPRVSVPRRFALEMTPSGPTLRTFSGQSASIRPEHAPLVLAVAEIRRPDLRGKVVTPDPTGGAGIFLRKASAEILDVAYEVLTNDE